MTHDDDFRHETAYREHKGPGSAIRGARMRDALLKHVQIELAESTFGNGFEPMLASADYYEKAGEMDKAQDIRNTIRALQARLIG